MTWEISAEDFERISAQDPQERYLFALKKIAQHTELWGLVEESAGLWAVGTDEEGQGYFPIWPHPQFAEVCAQEEWEGFVAQQVDLEDFVEELAPAIADDDQWVCLFSTPDSVGLAVDTMQLFKDLESELTQYE